MQAHPWLLVDTVAKAEEAVKDIGSSSVIGIDTEYDSLRYFREKLCLLQIRAEKSTYLFDPLGDLDFAILGKYFATPSICKIMHAGDNDIRILKRDYDFVFNNIFDTHRAALLLGCDRLSLAHVIGQYLGIEFEKKKSMQRSKWEQRPLSAEQLHYAAQDTAHLVDLYHKLEYELMNNGLHEEATNIFSEMTMTKWRKKSLKTDGHKKIERYTTLTEQQQKRLQRLFQWRYGKAKESNRAIFMILSDQDLIHLSGLEVCSLKDLRESGILPAEKVHLFGADIVKLLSIYEGSAECLS